MGDQLNFFSIIINRRPRSGRRLYLNPRKDLTINPKKSTKKIIKKSPYLNTILHNFASSTLYLMINPKKSTKKNQPKKSKKSPYLNTILHNYATSTLDLMINPKKSSNKNQPKK